MIPLSEGSFTIDHTKLFVPFNQEQDELNERPVGSLLVEIQPFLIQTSSDIILLDTGLGFQDKTHGKMQLHAQLAKHGISPDAVKKVILSHLHKDHAGGVSTGPDHLQLSFPHATYYIQRREFDFAMEKGFPSFITDELKVLGEHPQVHWLHEDEGMIGDLISYRVTGGHSPYHQVVWIRENEEIYFFGGDDAPQLQQMKVRYKTKYDFNPEKAMQLRQHWWKQGQQEGWTFLFYHDIKQPAFRILTSAKP